MTHDLLDALRVLMRDVAAVCTDEGQELELAPAMYQAAMAIERTTGEETTMQANPRIKPLRCGRTHVPSQAEAQSA